MGGQLYIQEVESTDPKRIFNLLAASLYPNLYFLIIHESLHVQFQKYTNK